MFKNSDVPNGPQNLAAGVDDGILQAALFKDKCGFIIVSFQSMSVSII